MKDFLDYWFELAEIIGNVWAAVVRGEVTEQDARDYLDAALHWNE